MRPRIGHKTPDGPQGPFPPSAAGRSWWLLRDLVSPRAAGDPVPARATVDPVVARAAPQDIGKALDLVAPGGDGRLNSTGDSVEDGVLQQTLRGGPSKWCYCYMASTSAAAAQVSGVTALLVASGRASHPAEIASALRSSAQDLGPPGRDAQYGAGLVQAAAAIVPAKSSPGRPSAQAHGRSSPATWLGPLALPGAGAVLLACCLLGVSVAGRTRRARERRRSERGEAPR